MAKSVVINGVVYSNVPYVSIPNSDGNGNAKFVDTSDANAVSENILSGKTAYVNGSLITGNIANKSSSDITQTGATINVPSGFYPSGASKTIATEEKTVNPSDSVQTITPTANKLLSKVTVNKVALSGDAVPGDVLRGKTFYGSNLTKLTGTATVPTVSQDAMTKVLTIA